jgi:hypothetical protein
VTAFKDLGPDQVLALRRLVRHFRPPCLLPRRKRTLWTQPYMIRPALVKQRFGNGKRLIGLSPVLHRPAYYLVWIDDRWNLSNWDHGEKLIDHLDEIWDAIGDEFGFRDREDESSYRWPEEDSRDGCSWWEADVDDVLPRRARRQLEARVHG